MRLDDRLRPGRFWDVFGRKNLALGKREKLGCGREKGSANMAILAPIALKQNLFCK
jgi:hypothetical protein